MLSRLPLRALGGNSGGRWYGGAEKGTQIGCYFRQLGLRISGSSDRYPSRMIEKGRKLPSKRVRKIGPRSGEDRLLMLDGRTREAQLLAETRRDLLRHVGERPNAVQARLIERAAMLTLYVAMFDLKAAEAGGLSERDSRQYLAYSNSLTRMLARLGSEPAAPPQLTLEQHLAALAARSANATA
jgi:hypothetical protein